MLRIFLATVWVAMPISAFAQPNCASGIGFHYLPADREDEMLWWEYAAPQLSYTINNEHTVFSDQQIIVEVYVTMIEEGSVTAEYVDFDHTTDGILFGISWVSLDEFEAQYRSMLCPNYEQGELLLSSDQ